MMSSVVPKFCSINNHLLSWIYISQKLRQLQGEESGFGGDFFVVGARNSFVDLFFDIFKLFGGFTQTLGQIFDAGTAKKNY